jgi:hypothetical protein
MTYAYSAWAAISKINTSIRRMKDVQNRALHVIGGYHCYIANNQIYFDNEIPMIKT